MKQTISIVCDHSREEIEAGTPLGWCRVCGFIVPLSSPVEDGDVVETEWHRVARKGSESGMPQEVRAITGKVGK